MESKYITAVNKSSVFNGSTLLLFFIWPVAALYASFLNYKEEWSKNLFWLFCIFFGFTFIIAGEGGADSDRYARALIQYAHSDLNLKELWNSFYSEGSSYVDIASWVIIYFVSRITDNPSVLFAVFGLVFGYFYSRNLWYILERIEGKFTGFLVLNFVTFALLNPIWNINGFRMYAAGQIFLFGTLPYLMEGNTKKLFWSGFSILFHFSFLYPLLSLFLFILLKNRMNFYLGFFILTSFIKEIDMESVRYTLSFLPDFFQSRVTGYTQPEYVESVIISQQSVNWYLHFSTQGIQWVTYLMTLFIYFFCRKLLRSRHDLMKLFCYSLLLYGFANISSLLPAGGRFIMVANTFMFAFFIIFISTVPDIRGLLLIKLLAIPFILLFCIVTMREGMDYYGLMTLIGNPLTVAFYSESVPLVVEIKRLL